MCAFLRYLRYLLFKVRLHPGVILEQDTKDTKNSVWNGPCSLCPGKALLDHFLREPEQRGEPPSQDCWVTACSIISGLDPQLRFLRYLLFKVRLHLACRWK